VAKLEDLRMPRPAAEAFTLGEAYIRATAYCVTENACAKALVTVDAFVIHPSMNYPDWTVHLPLTGVSDDGL
jgi:hypothetical protein